MKGAQDPPADVPKLFSLPWILGIASLGVLLLLISRTLSPDSVTHDLIYDLGKTVLFLGLVEIFLKTSLERFASRKNDLEKLIDSFRSLREDMESSNRKMEQSLRNLQIDSIDKTVSVLLDGQAEIEKSLTNLRDLVVDEEARTLTLKALQAVREVRQRHQPQN